MISVLNQPYPFYYHPDKLLKHSLTIACFITFFLILFKPFDTNINELRYNYYTTCVIYGIVASGVFWAAFSFMTHYTPEYCKEDKWTVGKELIGMLILLVIIGNLNFFIRTFINTNADNFKLAYYIEEHIHTCSVGIIPIGFFIALNFSYLRKSNTDKATISDSYIVKKAATTATSPPSIITIVSQSIYETASVNGHDICYIRSTGNYIEIYQCSNGGIKKQIIRNTLKDIEKQLSDYTNIVKTHRSHLVNVDQIRSVKGNAQGYTLHFKNCNDTIPVARNHIARFDKVIKELSV